MTERYFPIFHDSAACAKCYRVIREDEAKVPRGKGWLCQACAYEAAMAGRL